MAYETPQDAADMAMKPLTQMAETSASAVTAAGGSFFRVCADYNRETFDLMSRRARAYTSLPGDLTACTGAQDLLQLQSRFLETMMGDYRAHADKITGLMTDLSKTAVQPAQDQGMAKASAAPSGPPAQAPKAGVEKRAA